MVGLTIWKYGYMSKSRGANMVAYVQDLSTGVLAGLTTVVRHVLDPWQDRIRDAVESLRDERGANGARRIAGAKGYHAPPPSDRHWRGGK
jgi:hypothetical protein